MKDDGDSPNGRGNDDRGPGPGHDLPSDGELCERITDCLAQDPRLDARGVEIHVEGGVVELTGRVEDWWAKLTAEELARRCSGAREIRNRLRIQPRYLD